MPNRVARIIDTESPKNKSFGIITALAALLERDNKVNVAYLCHQSVIQISKLCGEGNHFCTYRNIQMLLPNPHPIYSIPELQDIIEKAWDQGFNPHGRVETGGIKGTRKHIGTSEVSRLLRLSLVPLLTSCSLRHCFVVSTYHARPRYSVRIMHGESFLIQLRLTLSRISKNPRRQVVFT